MYDSKCYELAMDWLEEEAESPARQLRIAQLAQAIQEAIEAWLSASPAASAEVPDDHPRLFLAEE